MQRPRAALWIPVIAVLAGALYMGLYLHRWLHSPPIDSAAAILLVIALMVPALRAVAEGAKQYPTRLAGRLAVPLGVIVFAVPAWNVVATIAIALQGRPLRSWVVFPTMTIAGAMAGAYALPIGASIKARVEHHADALDASLLAAATWLVAIAFFARASSDAQRFPWGPIPGAALHVLALLCATAAVAVAVVRYRRTAAAFRAASSGLALLPYQRELHRDVPLLGGDAGDAVIVRLAQAGEGPYRSTDTGTPIARTFFDRGRALAPLERRAAIAMCLLAVACVVAPLHFRSAQSLVPTPRRSGNDYASGPLGFPADCTRSAPIFFAPIWPSNHLDVAAIARRYESAYGVVVGVLSEVELPASAFDEERDQLIAEEVLEAMAHRYAHEIDPRSVIIGVTDRDLYIRGKSWRYAFSDREPPRAVVSSARMGSGDDADARLYKMITKNLGVLYCGRVPERNPRSVLFNDIRGPADLDMMDESVW